MTFAYFTLNAFDDYKCIHCQLKHPIIIISEHILTIRYCKSLDGIARLPQILLQSLLSGQTLHRLHKLSQMHQWTNQRKL